MTCQHCGGESDVPFCADCFKFVTSPPKWFHFDGDDRLVECPGLDACEFCKEMSKITNVMTVVGVDHKTKTITIRSA